MIAWLASPLGKLVLKGALILVAAIAVRAAIVSYQNNLIDRAFAEAEAKANAALLVTVRQQLKDERARVATLNEQLAAARTAAALRTEVLNRHNLGELMQAKPLMIERRINTATVEVWREIEDESREAR